jgi:hypothetical protein
MLFGSGPPFLGSGFVDCAQRFRRLLFGRENLDPEFDEPRSRRRIGQQPLH